MTLLTWASQVPSLRRPLLLVALDGFVDAGAVAETAATFLRHRWRAERIATFDPDTFLDYRARRPTAVVDSGQLRRVDLPALELFAAELDGPRDALLLLGPEPDMSWQAFCGVVVDLCRDLGVEVVLGLGAYPAAVPHTRPVRIMKAANSAAGDLVPEALPIPGYTGPVGLSSVLQAHLGEQGLAAIGLWVEVPHYIAASPNPTGALALVQLLAATLAVDVDTTELEAAATLQREQIDAAVAEHAEAAEMIAVFEQHVDDGETADPLPSGEDIAAEIERFLRSENE